MSNSCVFTTLTQERVPLSSPSEPSLTLRFKPSDHLYYTFGTSLLHSTTGEVAHLAGAFESIGLPTAGARLHALKPFNFPSHCAVVPKARRQDQATNWPPTSRQLRAT